MNILDTVNALETAMPHLDPYSRSKAYDLISGKYGFRTRGYLSPAQLSFVERLLAKATAPKDAPPELPAMAGVVTLLNHAQSHGLKYPKLWLQFADGTALRITLAGSRSRTPGWLMLTDGEAFGQSRFFGRISPQGDLQVGRDGHAVKAELTLLLTRLAADPVTVAREYAKLSGSCMFCGLALTDARSTAVGYGKTCAAHWGQPWGEVTTDAAATRYSALPADPVPTPRVTPIARPTASAALTEAQLVASLGL
jgi:hypothetical protein